MALCHCCGSRLLRRPRGGLERPIALMSAALILFLVANLFPLISLSLGGVDQDATLLGTSIALYQHGMKMVGGLVFLVSLLIPGAIMVITLHVLVSIRFRLFLPFTRRLLAFLSHLHPWEMGDVFLVSMLVAMVKLSGVARIIVDEGFYALAAAVVLAIAARSNIETWLLWRALDREPMPPLARGVARGFAGEAGS